MESFEIILTLMIVVWLSGKIFRFFKLPIIFGELIGGIVVGPLCLNLIDIHNEGVILLAELGVFFLMFHSGLETDPYKLLRASKKSMLIAIIGTALPFTSGVFVSQMFGYSLIESLFIAVALSTTAIAISVRLFKEYKIQGTSVANVALGAAVIDDILALVLFSVILNIHNTGEFDLMSLLFTLFKVILFFIVVMWLGFKTSKHISKLLARKGFTFALIMALILGLTAETIGLHMIIGAFLAGLFIRQEIVDNKIFNKIEDRIYGLSYSFLGPIFFASLAFHLDFTAIKTIPLFLVVILIVAILGKLIGAGGAAYIQGMNIKKSTIRFSKNYVE